MIKLKTIVASVFKSTNSMTKKTHFDSDFIAGSADSIVARTVLHLFISAAELMVTIESFNTKSTKLALLHFNLS